MNNNSLMHKTYLLIGMFLFVGFFQNCSSTSNYNAQASHSKNTKESPVAYQKIVSPTVDTLLFNLLPEDNRFFELKTSSGHIQEYSIDGQTLPASQFCLEQSEQEELQNILSSISVCVPHQENPKPDIVCAQSLIEPYAELMINQKLFRLGAQYDSCQIPIDLCDDQASLLKGYMTHLKQKFLLHPCNF